MNPVFTNPVVRFAKKVHLLQQLARFHQPSGVEVLTGRPDVAPIAHAGEAPSVLCLHGFCGVPGEVALCAEAAADLGLECRAPLLPGHGTTPRELASLRFEDWLAGARREFDQLRPRGPVILVGMSMGSLVATALTLEAPGDVAGLVLLSNAFWLKSPFPAGALRLVDHLRVPDFGFPKLGSDLGDEVAAASHISYQVQPVHSAISVLNAGRRLRKELFRVHCPTLVLHGARDRVTPVSNAWKAADEIGEEARVVIFPRSYHILTRDVDRVQVRKELRRFMKRIRKRVRKAA